MVRPAHHRGPQILHVVRRRSATCAAGRPTPLRRNRTNSFGSARLRIRSIASFAAAKSVFAFINCKSTRNIDQGRTVGGTFEPRQHVLNRSLDAVHGGSFGLIALVAFPAFGERERTHCPVHFSRRPDVSSTPSSSNGLTRSEIPASDGNFGHFQNHVRVIRSQLERPVKCRDCLCRSPLPQFVTAKPEIRVRGIGIGDDHLLHYFVGQFRVV